MSTAAETHCVEAERLLALLEEELQALHAVDLDRLTRVCRDKAQALHQLGGLLSVLRGAAGTIQAELRQRLHYTILHCQRQTRANEALLRVRARRTRGAMQALHGVPVHYDVRGRSGYPTANSGTLRGLA